VVLVVLSGPDIRQRKALVGCIIKVVASSLALIVADFGFWGFQIFGKRKRWKHFQL